MTRTEAAIIPTALGPYVQVGDPAENVTGEINRPAREVWDLLPAVYQQLGLGGRVVDTDRREYGSERVSGRRVNRQPIESYFRCGSDGTIAGSASRWRVQFNISTTVAELGRESSTLTTRISAFANPTDGASTGRILCVSIGTLEQAIFDALAAS
jgi:hypothetical protein